MNVGARSGLASAEVLVQRYVELCGACIRCVLRENVIFLQIDI